MKRIIYGWKSSQGKQLYVYERKSGWGVTEKPEEALRMDNIESCIFDWLSRHAFPENYAHLVGENHLQFFDVKSNQQLLFIDDGKYLQRFRAAKAQPPSAA